MDQDQFIKSVENVIPNPPFKIIIETADQVKVIDENTFMSIKADSLKNNSWDAHENIREIEISINEDGIVGSAIVAILESRGVPVDKINITSKKVSIESESYDLEKSFILGTNQIKMNSTTISINEENEIEESSTSNTLANSRSKFSLHGIEIPTTLFPDYYSRTYRNLVKIDWPLPILLVIDVCANRDLDLNSSRTQVLLSDNWFKFEEDLAYIICKSLSESVDENYWNTLKELLLNKTKNEYFISALNRVKR